MQLSVKTPPLMSLGLLQKLAEINHPIPSAFASDCVLQCLLAMKHPPQDFIPLPVVQNYYYAVGREHEILPHLLTKKSSILLQVEAESRAMRAKEAAQRLRKFLMRYGKELPPKHVHLKISGELPVQIKEKAIWLGLRPNAFVVNCLWDCLLALSDPKKALLPPKTVVDFWTVSKAHLSPSVNSGLDAMVFHTQERMVRDRSVQIMDMVVRYVLKNEWETPLQTILRDAGLPVDDDTKSS
jgi:hypothetical protein